jgi:cation:H+ antiporter
MLDALCLAAGLALLLGGGHMLVRGASGLARDLGVPPLVVGLTVVAFGTSAPELAVNVTAALRGDTALSFGNVVGSNIANIGLILAVASMMRPLEVRGTVISREIPMMLVATAAVIVLGLDRIVAASEGYDRSDGLILLLLFAVFLYYTVAEVLRGRARDPLLAQAAERAAAGRLYSIAASTVVAVVGLAVLVGGAEITVRAAVGLATELGVPDSVVGLTLVAVGTSLPELATSIMAVRSGQVDLAVGNVVGSNIFNLLFILGITSSIRAVPMPEGGSSDLIALAAFSAALLTVSLSQQKRIVRPEGAGLLALYLGYSATRVILG